MPQRTTVCWVLFGLKKQASANPNQSIENKFAKIKNKTKRKEIKLGAWVLYNMPERELTYLCKRSVHLSNANLAQKKDMGKGHQNTSQGFRWPVNMWEQDNL